jgi:hypothetical protein
MSPPSDRRERFDPEFCESRCPICTRARAGHRLARALQTLERWLTFGGCPFGRARRRRYGVEPHQPLPTARRESGED